MSKKLLVVACVVLVAVIGANAQNVANARTGAMANTGIVDDPVRILKNPAFVNNYPDLLQITLDTAMLVQPVIGVKSITEMVSAGLSYTGMLVPKAPLLAFLGTTDGALAITALPHLLLGLNLDAVQLGFDLYWERSNPATHIKTVTPGAPSTTVETKTSSSFNDIGFLAGANLMQDQIPIRITLGYNLPLAGGSTTTKTSAAAVTTTSTKLNANFPISLSLGAEIAPKLGDMELVTGLNYDMASFGKTTQVSIATSSGGTDSTYTINSGEANYYHSLAGYAGLNANFENDIIFTSILQLGWNRHTSHPDDQMYSNPDSSQDTLGMFLRGGTEKSFTGLKWFDAVNVRAGLTYGLFWGFAGQKVDSAGNVIDAGQRTATVRNAFAAYLGAGVAKNIFGFDIQIDPVAILNVFKLVHGLSAPNDLARATLTLDFGGKTRSASSSSSSSGSTSTPASGYQTPSFGGSSTTPAPSTDPGTGTGTTTTPGF